MPSRETGLRVLRFAMIGLAATLLYAVLAITFEAAFRLGPVPASVLAYGCSAAFSYFGHKFITFLSAGEHRKEAPRFIATALAGFGLATAAPAILTHWLGLPSWVAIAFTCLVIPLVNLLVLDRWVFSSARVR